MLERRLAAKKAKSVFFEERNTIDIYIEDTAIGYRKIYKCILSRLLGENFLINDIFPLGGKSAVLCSWENDENKRNRPRIYIVDGDIDLLSGIRVCQDGLYTLPYYCIENLFICERSIIDILVEEDPEKEHDELYGLLDFEGWERANEKLLFDLFITYSIVKKHAPHFTNVNYQVSKLVNNNRGELDPEKVKRRISDLDRAVLDKISTDELKEEKEKIMLNIKDDMRIKKYISGKDYLLPLIITRMKSIVNTKISNLNFKNRISNKCYLGDLQDISKSILY
ncbi:DUF4435 domain-containing protein [Dickeya sp. ws52]|uniref:DUF4435 domain-containing protein n=1 Tax=Dickeya sp. ws52 TaxID=2576377 RepID=UPI0018FE4468|nr:DUF4435 domain-containing protein [Dickeya sp. ws52]